ncbi:xanthine dehydrogenase accessory protein XdhC [Phreatobacter sp.]|uniref:xanthine dehydrogenase accessory protein XdhC n=1 Tax=Phreatobacter sp. TaxID=1966341 RepID=UPI003F6EEC41
MEVWPRIEAMIEAGVACVLVSVVATRGSVPREAGARMIVRPDGAFHGTIGGGALEWQAQAHAQALLSGNEPARLIGQALGPDLGQCCGGHVTLLAERFIATDLATVRQLAAQERLGAFRTMAELRDGRVVRKVLTGAADDLAVGGPVFLEAWGDTRTTLLLFGSGHVGRALVLALAPLPVRVLWWDGRQGAFPPAIPASVLVVAGHWQALLDAAPEATQVLVMTHSHALDLAIVAAALADPRGLDVGLIGSASKRARFAGRLREAGLPDDRIAALRCPIGIPGLAGKEPAVIAASVAAECLILAGHRATTATVQRPTARRA